MGVSKKVEKRTLQTDRVVIPRTASAPTNKANILAHKNKVAGAIEYKRILKNKSNLDKRTKIDRIKKDEFSKIKEDEQIDEQGYFVQPEELDQDAADEEMLDMFGSLPLTKASDKNMLNKSEKKQAQEQVRMAQNLDEKIDNKKEAIRQDEIRADFTKDPKVQKVYGDIATLFEKYRSGKLPQAFRILSKAEQWENLIKLTKPENWTPHAMWAASKAFIIEMTAERLKIFFENYQVPAIRKDIAKNKKLNYQYFAALQKAFWKPAAWFRGILFPICKDPELKSREATILASILHNRSIPATHASIAIMKLTLMPYSGPVNQFFKAQVTKRYALPASVINCQYDWFMGFKNHTAVKMPVIWFQTVLGICELYSEHFTQEQKDEIKKLVKKIHKHEKISPAIVRQLSGRGTSQNVTMNMTTMDLE